MHFQTQPADWSSAAPHYEDTLRFDLDTPHFAEADDPATTAFLVGIVLALLHAARQFRAPQVILYHGASHQGDGIALRAIVRHAVQDPRATPLLIPTQCLQFDKALIAALRPAPTH